MILFKPEHVQPILDGRKTQTRRMGNRRWKDGAIHQARTRMLDADSTFARLRIIDVHREDVTRITNADARAEGYDNAPFYLAAFARINGLKLRDLPGTDVWVVEFEAVAP